MSMQNTSAPDAKKPCKGILKNSSSFDKTGASYRKSAKFDELNVLQTLHPADKDYGHMKIDEPKTPYNYEDADAEPDQLDANLLAEKLKIAANTDTPSFNDEDNSDDEFPETGEEKVRRLEFERRRKSHYNEFEAVRLARKLIEEEFDDDETNVIEDDMAAGESKKSESEYKEESVEAEHEEKEVLGDESSIEKSSEADPEASALTTSSRMDVDDQFDPSHPCARRQE